MKKIGVIGIGNPLRSDDGIGIVLLEKLKENKKDLPRNVDLLDGGTGGFNLLHDLSKYEKVIILDAVNINKKPGETSFINIKEVKSKNKKTNLTTHFNDFFKIIDLSEKLDELPNEMYLYAVQPKDLSYVEGLSNLISKKIDLYLKDITEKIKDILKDF